MAAAVDRAGAAPRAARAADRVGTPRRRRALWAARGSAKLPPVMRFLLVCLGGAAGTGARYLFGLGAQRLTGGGFPFGTVGVNLIGSFSIVVIMQLGLEKQTISPDLRVILTTGVMGGFTTYSAFNYETVQFLRTGAVGLALLNLGVTLVGCLLAAAVGFLLAR
jgi:CrcB protein